MNSFRPVSFILVLGLGLLISGCGGGGGGGNPSGPNPPVDTGGGRLVQSNLVRIDDPQPSSTDQTALVVGQRAFSFALGAASRSGTANAFFSPFSVWQALAMTRAGATGTTAVEMDSALRTQLPQDRFHQAGNRLDLDLAARGSGQAGFRLSIVNALWGQEGESFLTPFLDTLTLNYGAGLRALDFAADPEAARTVINGWVAARTENRIPDLLPQGSIDTLTRLVLTNAISFKADWATPFPAENTGAATFFPLNGTGKEVRMMRRSGRISYATGAGWQAVELPYVGNQLAMLLILPADGTFARFEQEFSDTALASMIAALGERELRLEVPRFTIRSTFSLRAALQSLGMQTAFDPVAADFSPIDGRRDLYISDVVHQAFVDLYEKGTEAAAATGVIIGTTSAPVEPDLVVRFDRPFLFVLRDRPTGAILFMGRNTAG